MKQSHPPREEPLAQVAVNPHVGDDVRDLPIQSPCPPQPVAKQVASREVREFVGQDEQKVVYT